MEAGAQDQFAKVHYCIICAMEPLTVDTSEIRMPSIYWTLACVPIVINVYKSISEIRTPLILDTFCSPKGVQNREVSLYMLTDRYHHFVTASTAICPGITLINGDITYIPRSSPLTEGVLANLSCNFGYQLAGDWEQRCENNGTNGVWSGQSFCQGIFIVFFIAHA